MRTLKRIACHLFGGHRYQPKSIREADAPVCRRCGWNPWKRGFGPSPCAHEFDGEDNRCVLCGILPTDGGEDYREFYP